MFRRVGSVSLVVGLVVAATGLMLGGMCTRVSDRFCVEYAYQDFGNSMALGGFLLFLAGLVLATVFRRRAAPMYCLTCGRSLARVSGDVWRCIGCGRSYPRALWVFRRHDTE